MPASARTIPLPPFLLAKLRDHLASTGGPFVLRHSHKTWLIADGISEIAQAQRPGYRLANRLVKAYSHVAPKSKPGSCNG